MGLIFGMDLGSKTYNLSFGTEEGTRGVPLFFKAAIKVSKQYITMSGVAPCSTIAGSMAYVTRF